MHRQNRGTPIVNNLNNSSTEGFWLFLIGLLAWWSYDSGYGSCDEYASEYSCGYVVDRADYEVFYWENLQAQNAEDERAIGRVVGLRECKNVAMRHAALIREVWNERAYICVLVDDGAFVEKHRLL